jgi:hypothetical protein
LAITNGYATLAETKAALRISDAIDDTLLEMAIESASRLIDGYASRNFYSSGTATRYYVADNEFVVQVDDLANGTVTVRSSEQGNGLFDVTWDTDDYQLEPLNAVLDGQAWPFTSIRAIGDYLWPIEGGEALVQITGTWGWPAVPIAIKQACIIQASRIYKRLDSPLGVAGFGDLGAIRVSRNLDPDVEQLVMPYKRMRNFA